MRVLDLFSGIGGFSLGLERAGMETVAFCEVDQFCRKLLRQNFAGIPIYEDIRTLRKSRLEADGIRGIDLICGGFPCQPFSNAGKRKGKDDNRDLWPEMFRVIQECGPAWVIGENVAGFVNMELERTISDLEGQGYQVRAFNIPACAIEAPHERKRIWIVAHRDSNGRGWVLRETRQGSNGTKQRKNFDGESFGDGGHGPACKGTSAYSPTHPRDLRYELGGHGRENKAQQIRMGRKAVGVPSEGWWTSEPDVGRVANGVPHRVDRIKALGNAVIPQILEIIGKAIMDADKYDQ